MKNAVWVKSRSGDKEGDTVKAVHYFVSSIEIEGKTYAVQLLARHTIEKKSGGTHLRRLKLEEVDLDASPLRAQLTDATGIPYPTSRSKIHIVDILRQIKIDNTEKRFLTDEEIDDFIIRYNNDARSFEQNSLNNKDTPDPTTTTPPSELSIRAKKTTKAAEVTERKFAQADMAFSEAREYGKRNIAGKSYKNTDTGWDISVGSKAINKTVRSAQGSPEHLVALQVLPELIENSVLFDSREGRKGAGEGGDGITALHRLASAVKIDDKLYRAKLTVKRNDQKKMSGNHFYEMKLEEVELEVHKVDNSSSEDGRPGYATSSSTIDIVDLFHNVKRESDDQPVLTEQGAKEYEQSQRADSADTDKAPRGSIRFPEGGITKGRTLITLFETADRSTILHEMSHHFLEVLRVSAQMPGAMPEVKQMWATTKEPLGIEGDDFIPRAAHEKWARSGEIYFGSGKAPSAELKSSFERFRGWMLHVWASVRGQMGADADQRISPEIRDVFDRMLATDEQISLTRAETEGRNAIRNPDAVGMSKREWAEYNRLRQDTVDEAESRAHIAVAQSFLERQQDEFKAASAELEHKARENVAGDKAIRAAHILGSGRDPVTGENLPGIGDIRLNTDDLIDMGYSDALNRKGGKDAEGANRRQLPRGMRHVYAADGLHPDVVAPMFGFKSGRALVDAIISAPKFRDAVKVDHDRLVRETYGDIFADGTIPAETRTGLHGDARARMLELELQVLDRQARNGNRRTDTPSPDGDVAGNTAGDMAANTGVETTLRAAASAPSNADIRAVVDQQIDTMPLSSAANADLFLAAEQKFAREAAEAVENGDLPAAREAKLRQLYNFHLWRQADGLSRDVAAAEKPIKKVLGEAGKVHKRATTPAADDGQADFTRAARFILSRHGRARAPQDFDFDAWYADLQTRDPDTAAMLGSALALAGEPARVPTDQTIADHRQMMEAVNSLLTAADRQGQVTVDGETVPLADIRTAFADQPANDVDTAAVTVTDTNTGTNPDAAADAGAVRLHPRQ